MISSLTDLPLTWNSEKNKSSVSLWVADRLKTESLSLVQIPACFTLEAENKTVEEFFHWTENLLWLLINPDVFFFFFIPLVFWIALPLQAVFPAAAKLTQKPSLGCLWSPVGRYPLLLGFIPDHLPATNMSNICLPYRPSAESWTGRSLATENTTKTDCNPFWLFKSLIWVKNRWPPRVPSCRAARKSPGTLLFCLSTAHNKHIFRQLNWTFLFCIDGRLFETFSLLLFNQIHRYCAAEAADEWS